MKPTSTLLTAMVIFLFSLASLQGLRLLSSNDPKVLGETTQAVALPSPQFNSGIPCALINTWQKQYCSGNTLPTPFPSIHPTEPPRPSIYPTEPPKATITPQTCREIGYFCSESSQCCRYPQNVCRSGVCSSSAPTPTPATASHLETSSNSCLPNGNISSVIKGIAVISGSNSGFWQTITDNTTHNMIIRGWQSSGGYNTPVSDNPSDVVWDTKKIPTLTLPLVGDGRTFTYTIYEGAYNSSSPNLDSLKLLTSTTFGGIRCSAQTDHPTSTPAPAPLP